MDPKADFLRIGHRGASAACPENTLVSFRRALDQGAQMIECDLQLTADGEVVIFHDWTLERTTDGEGEVGARDLAYLRTLDAGAWKAERFTGEPIPSLAETLETVLPSARLNLELKCRGPAGEAERLARAAVSAVGSRDAFDRVIFSSFDAATLRAVREASPSARIGVLWIFAPFDEAFGLAGELAAAALHPRAEATTPELVDEAHRRGLSVNVWTVNEPEAMLELVGMGVDGLISDHPDRLLEARTVLLEAAGS